MVRTVAVSVIGGAVVTDAVVTVTVVVAVSRTVEASRFDEAVLVTAGNVTMIVVIEVEPGTLFVAVIVTGDFVVVQAAPVTVTVVERPVAADVTVLVTSEMRLKEEQKALALRAIRAA